MSYRYLFLLCFIMIGMSSCKKEAGDGGLATIEGTIYYNSYSLNGVLIEKIPAAGENIYLTYGDHDPYDDRNDSYTDGTYQFTGLQKGTYTVSAFSDCNCPSGVESVDITVEITDKKGTTSVADIEVTKTLDYNDGTASISGIIVEALYNTNIPPTVDASYLKPNEYAYIVYGNDAAYFDRVKTDANGVFEFTELLQGNYRIYAFSDCNGCPSGIDTKEATTQVVSNGQSLSVGTLTIEKR